MTDAELKKHLSHGTIAVTGNKYYLPTDAEIDSALASPRVRELAGDFKWEDSVSDCSWAAWLFVGLFAGTGWAVSWEVVEGHSLVRMLNSDRKEVWIEPQTGQRTTNTRKLILSVVP